MTTPGDMRRARAFAREVLEQHVVFDGLRTKLPLLIERGIDVMPLKGILLAWTIYERPEERPVGDADLLVHPWDFERALAILVAAGGKALPRGALQKVPIRFPLPGGWWTIDLHAELWEPGFADLDLAEAWRAATPWRSPYGVALAMPPRSFTFAHCTAHFARNAYTSDESSRVDEVARLLDWALQKASPHELVAALDRHHALSAAYYALAAASLGRPNIARFLERMPIGPVRAALLRRAARSRRPLHPRLLRPWIEGRWTT